MVRRRRRGHAAAMSLRPLWTAALLVAACAAQTEPTDVARLDADARTALQQRLADHLAAHARAPVEYLAACLGRHDVVLLGENHHVRENCALVAEVLAPLHRDAELRWLCTEFLRVRQTEAANRIAQAETWDESAAVALLRDLPWPTWGFRDYLDILRAVWAANRTRPDGAPPLRIQGLDSDWNQHALWFGDLDPRARFELLMQRERTMIQAIEEGPLKIGGKALAHVGFAHSVTCQGERLGTVLRRQHGQRVFQVALHQDLPCKRQPSVLATLVEQAAASQGPCGFDVRGTPFAPLTDGDCRLFGMLPRGTFGELNEGYVYLKPLAELGRMRWIQGFVTPERFAETEAVAVKLGWVQAGQCADAAALDRALMLRFPADG